MCTTKGTLIFTVREVLRTIFGKNHHKKAKIFQRQEVDPAGPIGPDSDPLKVQTLNSLFEKSLSAPLQKQLFKTKITLRCIISSISQSSVFEKFFGGTEI